MRCLTLAQALRSQNREVEFVCRHLPGHLIDLVRQHGFVTHELPPFANPEHQSGLLVPIEQDADETRAILQQRPLEWLVVDHYGIDARWERKFETETQRLMVIDDTADRDHVCHLLLDQNFSRDPQRRYAKRVSPMCTSLLGPQYALLRDEFAYTRQSLRQRDGRIRHVLVFFGGSDPNNLTGLTLKALASHDFSLLRIDVVLGASNPHRERIAQQLRDFPNGRLYIQVNNMAELMANADLFIGAGGGSTWERMCLGLPSAVITIAPNQVDATRDLHEEGLLQWAGDHEQISVDRLHSVIKASLSDAENNCQQSRRGMALVDGCGANRVASVMCSGIPAATLRLRRACAQDLALYWRWANDPETRRNSIGSDPIPWSSHIEWFRRAIASPDKWLFVADGPYGPVGQVRFERICNAISINYSISPQFRGRGLAKGLLMLAIEALVKDVGHQIELKAVVKKSNMSSAKVFESLAFICQSSLEADLLSFYKFIQQ